MLSSDTGWVGAASNVASMPRGLTWARSFNVTSNRSDTAALRHAPW
jgi:hypothetical protein